MNGRNASGTWALAAVLIGPGLALGAEPVVEIRSYNLKARTRHRFHRLFEGEALPLLRRWKVDVVVYGPSLHDRDSYYLMRAYSILDDRPRSQDALYGTDDWRRGAREPVPAWNARYT